jgi:myo-inositol-1(or 4)-monophosphatase
MNPEKITHQVADLTREVGVFIRDKLNTLSKNDIHQKGIHDLVTYVDKESETKLVEKLRKILSVAGFIAEENQSLKQKEGLNWIIDPLDGTTNFVHGVPIFSISVALMHSGEIISGVVYEVVRDECFYAWKDGGAYLNGKKISVSRTDKLDDSLIATGFPYYDYSLMEPYIGLFRELMETTHGLRRLGSAAADLAYLACGRFEVFYEYGLNPWDVAAGAMIVREAGGKVTDFMNADHFLFGRQIIASNTLLHDEFVKKLMYHFKDHLK